MVAHGRTVYIMLRIAFATLSALMITGSYSSELGGRLLAVLLPLKPHEAMQFEVSPDRRTVYAVTYSVSGSTVHALSDATLHVIRVSNPAAPDQVAQLPLGDFSPQQLVASGTLLFVLTRAVSPNASVVVVDVHDGAAPVVTDRLAVRGYILNVADDGRCVGIGGFGDALDAFGSYTVTARGKLLSGPCAGLKPSILNVGGEIVLDRRGSDSLVLSGQRLLIRTVSGANRQEHGLYVPGLALTTPRFLGSDSILAAEIFDRSTPQGSARLVSLNGGVLPFDAARLREAYAALMQEYEQLHASASGELPPYIFESLASSLADAGATEALAETPAQLTRSGLVAILNNWGYWQSRGTRPAAAIPTLRRIAEIVPVSAVAWRNLGDAARASLSGAVPALEQERLTRLALSAYATYRKLTGHYEPDMADFVAFNAFNAPRDNVCHFVAEYYTHGRRQEISGVAGPIDVDGSGRKVNLEIRYGGSLLIPYVHVTDEKGRVVLGPAFGLGYTENNASGNILLVPFGASVYAVTESGGAPTALYDWSGRQICDFTASYTAAIRRSTDERVCKQLLRGPLAPILRTQTLPTPRPTAVTAGPSQSFWAEMSGQGIVAFTDVDLSGTGHIDRVGSFTGYEPHGSCRMSGVVIMNGAQQESSARNAALLKAQWDLKDCRDAGAVVVRDQGHPYVEIDSTRLRNNEVQARTLLRVTATGVNTICRVVERPTYTGYKD